MTPNPSLPYPDPAERIIPSPTPPFPGDFGDFHGDFGDFGGDFGDFGYSGDPKNMEETCLTSHVELEFDPGTIVIQIIVPDVNKLF